MPLTPEVLTAQGEVVAWLGSLDVSFAAEEEPWFTIDGVENPGRSAATAPAAPSCCCRRGMCSTSHRKAAQPRARGVIASFDACILLLVSSTNSLLAAISQEILRTAAISLECDARREDVAGGDTRSAYTSTRPAEETRRLDLLDAYDAVRGFRRHRAGHRRQPVHDAVQPLQHRQQPDAAQRGGVRRRSRLTPLIVSAGLSWFHPRLAALLP